MSMDLFKEIIFQIFSSIFILTIWFNTEAFVEYATLLKLDKIFRIDKFKEYKNTINPDINYHTYLMLKHSTFFTRLISCPFCVNFWLVFLLSVIFNNLFLIPVVYITSISVYLFLERRIYL